MNINIGPERLILSDGLQPFMFCSAAGTLFVQGQLSFPPGYEKPSKLAFPGLPGNVTSRNGGASWERWYPKPDQGLGPTIEGASVQLADGTILLVDWVAQGPDDNGLFHGRLWESTDDLLTFEGPVPITVNIPGAIAGRDDGGHPYPAVTFHRSIVLMPGGELMACVYGWLAGDDVPVGYVPSMHKFRCMLVRSEDRGRTWRFVSTIAVDRERTEEGFDEPVLVRISQGEKAGRLVCMLRSGSSDQPIYVAVSDDEGMTWTPPRELAIRGVDPDLIEMRDGRLVASIGRRHWDQAYRDRRVYQIAVSDDAGETWTIAGSWGIEPHAGVDNITSYSALREVEPGRLIVIYDMGTWTMAVRYLAMREVTLGVSVD